MTFTSALLIVVSLKLGNRHALPLCKSVFLLTNYLVVAFLDDETKGSNIFNTTNYFRNFYFAFLLAKDVEVVLL